MQTYSHNRHIQIFSDGTKIRFQEYEAEYPESIDIKITNRCDNACTYCHEESHPGGATCDFTHLKNMLGDLPHPTEIALGGGNPALFPKEVWGIQRNVPQCIFNMTVHEKDIDQAGGADVNAYGVSVIPKKIWDQERIDRIKALRNHVVHLIVGVHSILEFDFVAEHFPRVLLLGFKDMGRGKRYTPKMTGWDRWMEIAQKYDSVVALDNLAIKQLNARGYLTNEEWSENYMGDDGQYTMFIDAVEKTYGRSSTHKRYPIGNKTIKEMFASLKELT